MAATLTNVLFDAAPGNKIMLTGSGLTPGVGASVSIANQGVDCLPNLIPAPLTLPAVFAVDGLSVTIGPVPDGIMSGVVTVTASDATQATASMRAVSQYAQASEYIGEGMRLAGLAPMTAQGVSELDVILRRASTIADSVMIESIRLLQTVDTPKYQEAVQGMAPKLYPWRIRGRNVPIVSVDELVFVAASNLRTVFNSNDVYANSKLKYIEILAYAVGTYALLGEIQVIGYSANVFEVAYTSGYAYIDYPPAVRDATIIIATKMLKQRALAAMNMGDVKSFEDKLEMDTTFVIPDEARRLLRPFISRTFS